MHFSGAATADMESCIKPTLQRNTDEVILHIGTNGLRSKKRTTGTRKQYYRFMDNRKQYYRFMDNRKQYYRFMDNRKQYYRFSKNVQRK